MGWLLNLGTWQHRKTPKMVAFPGNNLQGGPSPHPLMVCIEKHVTTSIAFGFLLWEGNPPRTPRGPHANKKPDLLARVLVLGWPKAERGPPQQRPEARVQYAVCMTMLNWSGRTNPGPSQIHRTAPTTRKRTPKCIPKHTSSVGLCLFSQGCA